VTNPLQLRALNDYAWPVIIAHRGNASINVENSMSAFSASSAVGAPVEMDAVIINDSSELGMMHDTTVDRTTSSTGSAASFTATQWKAITLDPSAWFGAGYPDTEKLPLFSEVCALMANRGVFLPEAKSTGSGLLICKIAKRFGIQSKQMIVQSFNLAELVAPADYGYECLFLVSALSTITDWQALKDRKIKYVCYGNTESGNDARIASARSVGINVLRYTRNRRTDVATELALGAIGVMSDEAEYLSATKALATRDTFTADGKWMSGMIANFGNRGLIYPGYVWGYETLLGGYAGCLMGWACPLATPTNFTLTFTAKHESLLSGDTTRWISAFICADDDTEHKDLPNDKVSGYHILIRASGTIHIYKKAKGVAIGAPLATSESTAFTIGDFVTFSVVVTPTAVSITRSDVAQTTTLTDSTYRGGYFHLGRSGCSAKFKDIIIT
jgi:glycerophosphoryl diester phosphodiesterase